MSLLNKNKAFSVRDYLFVAVGLLGLFWFFLSYASNDPRSTIQIKLDKQSAELKAMQVLNDLGYKSDNLETRVGFRTNSTLLDSLQAHLGRRKMIKMMSDTTYPGIYPYFWEIEASNMRRGSGVEAPGEDEDHVLIRLSESGRFIGLINNNSILPDRSLNRKALISAFQTDSTLKLWTSLPDSAWNRVLSFNIEENFGSQRESDTLRSQEGATKKTPHEYSRDEIRRLAEYYLQQAGWNPEKLSLDDIQIKTIQSQTAAELNFRTTKPYLGQSVQLRATVLPTGALLDLSARYNSSQSNNRALSISQLVRTILLMLFGLATLIIFYLRIRARAVDTNPALVVGIIAGLVIPAVLFLDVINEQIFFGPDAETSDLVSLALQMGFAGAFASIAFFVVLAVADSLMRQYWPEKLYGYDYLRQGMLFNKPVGEIVVRSLVIAFLLCGIWTTLLYFFPDLYLKVDRALVVYESAWPPVYLLLDTAWFSAIMILGIFGIVGTQVVGLFRNVWSSALATVVVVALICPFFQRFGPLSQEIALFAILGVGFTYVFLKWDLLTTLLSHFIFILIIQASTGWIVQGSPDLYVFVICCAFLVLLAVTGSLAVAKGKERQALPTFVPEYVEELAQEQRIKQELQIAREVQQSFLPVRTPEFEELELAAICKPAYETGGDYYDFVRLDDYRVAVMIGDVSGKGIQAAFYMTFVKGVIHSLCREIDSPAEVLKKTNHLFCENAPRGTFISLVYGIVDLKKKQFYFARAGHNPILRVTSGDGKVEELQPSGIGIGLARGDSFEDHIEEVKLPLSEDDMIVLYTDGIVEALNEGNTFYGTQRLNSTLKRNKQKSAKEVLELLAEDVHSFIGNAKQHDDMTMLVMKLKKTTDDS